MVFQSTFTRHSLIESHQITASQTLRAGLMASAVLVFAMVGTPAAAQTDQSKTDQSQTGSNQNAGAGDIIVTAQRRSESIQKVGISITALSGDQLAKDGINSSTQLAAQVPALQFDSGSGGGVNAFVSIRGVSQVDYSEHQEAPNAVYLDGVYVPTPSMVGFPLYDMERAEALRGPQGTLFGRNSTGGLLQFVTKDPTDQWTGFFNSEYSSYADFRGEAAVGGPIARGLSFRVAGMAEVGNGYFKNDMPGGKNTFERYVFGIRGKLRADLGGSWSAMLTSSLNKSPKHREGTYKAFPEYVDANSVTQFVPANVDIYGTGPGNDPFGYRDPSTSGNEGSFNSFGYLKKQTHYETLKIEGPVGGATFTSLTNYTSASIDYLEDSDATPNDVFSYRSGGHTRQVSEELRLNGKTGRLEYTVGAYFLDLKGSYFTDFIITAVNPTLGISPFDAINTYQQHTQSYAVFGQIEYALTDQLKLTLGGRYNHDRKIFDSQVRLGPKDPNYTGTASDQYYDFNAATAAAAGVSNRQNRGDWAGKVQLSYQPDSDLLIYVGVSRGIRGGGFNATADGSTSYNIVPFKNETVIAYEAGTKIRLLGDAATLRASAYYYDYTGFQAFNFTGLISTVSNNNAYFSGGEVELFLRPTKGLNISLGAAYLDAKVKGVATPNGVQDVVPTKAPKWTLNGQISKVFDIGDFQLTAQYDFNYLSTSKANLVPSPVTTLPASWMQNARISFGREDKGWQLYAFVKNLADVNRKTFAYDNAFVGIALGSYAPPRTFGVGFRKDF
jgi:iron complex outermembrane receptor protein